MESGGRFEQRRNAVAIYEDIIGAAITGTFDRQLSMSDYGGVVDYPDRNWRLSIRTNDNVSDRDKAERYYNAFTSEEFDRGVIIVGQGPIEKRQSDIPTSSNVRPVKILATETSEGYKAIQVKGMGVGQPPVLTEVSLGEEIVDAIGRVKRLAEVPVKILDAFGSYEAFRSSLEDGLQGRPLSGVVDYDPNGLNVFGGASGQRLDEAVKRVELRRRGLA